MGEENTGVDPLCCRWWQRLWETGSCTGLLFPPVSNALAWPFISRCISEKHRQHWIPDHIVRFCGKLPDSAAKNTSGTVENKNGVDASLHREGLRWDYLIFMCIRTILVISTSCVLSVHCRFNTVICDHNIVLVWNSVCVRYTPVGLALNFPYPHHWTQGQPQNNRDLNMLSTS